MGRQKKLLGEEELEQTRDEYNKLTLREAELLKQYNEARRLCRIAIVNNLRKTAMKLLLLESIIDKNTR